MIPAQRKASDHITSARKDPKNRLCFFALKLSQRFVRLNALWKGPEASALEPKIEPERPGRSTVFNAAASTRSEP